MPNIQFLNRPNLYKLISKKIDELGFNIFSASYKIDSIDLAHKVCENLVMELIDFKEIKICGILHKGKGCTSMALNLKRSKKGRNFDCMHELVHYWFHDTDFFYCVEGAQSHMEWQANEGAAQFLMPYQNFIPIYCNLYDKICKNGTELEYQSLIAFLSNRYMVGERAISIRIKSLSYEIAEYMSGVDIRDLKILLSKNKHNTKKIANTI